MNRAEIISVIVEISLVAGVLSLIALAIYKPKQFFRSVFIDFPVSVFNETSERIIVVIILISTPFVLIWKFLFNKRKASKHTNPKIKSSL